MSSLEYARTYIDELLINTMGAFGKNITCLEEVLKPLLSYKLRVNMRKYNFSQDKADYLG